MSRSYMRHIRTYLLFILTAAVMMLGLAGCKSTTDSGPKAKSAAGMDVGAVSGEEKPDEQGTYTSKEEVALYIHSYGKLPSNYITKKEAQKLGWNSKKGNLDEVAPGKSIGGDRFGNYDKKLPDIKGVSYKECDIGYEGGFRNASRIIFSNKGAVYYTEDHYNSFEELYEGEKNDNND